MFRLTYRTIWAFCGRSEIESSAQAAKINETRTLEIPANSQTAFGVSLVVSALVSVFGHWPRSLVCTVSSPRRRRCH